MTDNIHPYQRLQIELAELIEKTVPGDRLPSEPQLAQQMGVSRATLREAMRAFEGQGLIRRRQGIGTFVVGRTSVIESGLEVLKAYFEAGVGCVLMMHFPEADLREAREQNLAGNLIITGHMASDSIGINVYLDELERRGLEVIRAGGIIVPR